MKWSILILVVYFLQGGLSQPTTACAGDVAKDLAAALKPFKTEAFVEAVNDADVLDTTAWTIFAPTDDAWEAFLEANDIPIAAKSRSTAQAALVDAVLKAHLVANNKVEVRYSQNGQTTTLQTLLKDMSVVCGPGTVPGQQNQLEFTPVTGGFNNDGEQSGKAVAEVESSGGVKVETIAADQEISCLQGFALHVVPKVLSPCKTLKAVAANPEADCDGTIVAALKAAEQTDTAAGLLEKALPDAFKGAVFLPNNAALEKLSSSLAAYLKSSQPATSNIENAAQALLSSEAMGEVLQYHLVPGTSDLSSSTGQLPSGPLTTALSPSARLFCKDAPAATLSYKQVGDKSGTITDGAGQTVNVLDMKETCNGTVATIDSVLLPCSWEGSNVLNLLGADPAETSPPSPTTPVGNSPAIDIVTPNPEVDPTVEIPGQQTEATYTGAIIIPGAANNTAPAVKRSLPPTGTAPLSASAASPTARAMKATTILCFFLGLVLSTVWV